MTYQEILFKFLKCRSVNIGDYLILRYDFLLKYRLKNLLKKIKKFLKKY